MTPLLGLLQYMQITHRSNFLLDLNPFMVYLHLKINFEHYDLKLIKFIKTIPLILLGFNIKLESESYLHIFNT